MALKLRRGSDAIRQTITPSEGELLYTTDTKKVFVGDGSTLGGTQVSSGVPEGTARSLTYYIEDGVNVSPTINLQWSDLTNQLIVDRGTAIVTNESGARSMLILGANYNEATGATLSFTRSRGNIANPSPLLGNDGLGNITFSAYPGYGTAFEASAGISPYMVTPTAVGSPFTVNFVSKTGTGPYYVTYNFVTQGSAPTVSKGYVIEGNSNIAYNGLFRVYSSTTSSMTLYYPTDPGTFGTGTTTAKSNAILSSAIGLLTQTSNGNYVRNARLFNNGLFLIGPLAAEFTTRPYDSSQNGQIAVNSTQTNVSQTAASAQVTLRTYADTTYGQSFNVLRYRGTIMSPTATQSGDEIQRFKWYGSDIAGGNAVTAATLSVTVDSTVSAGVVPGAITISTANSSGVLTSALKIDSTQTTTVYGPLKQNGLEIRNVNYLAVDSTGTFVLSTTITTNVLLVSTSGLTATLTLPPSPVDGQVLKIVVSGNAVTLASSGSPTIVGSFSGSTTAGSVLELVYRTSNTSWYRIG